MKVVVDYREQKSGPVELLRQCCEVEIGRLVSGDYLINDHVLVERKTARDFLLSIVDTRLFRQVSRLQDSTRKTALVIEGDPFRTDLEFSPEAVRGALLSCMVTWQLPVVFSSSTRETAEILLAMGKQDEKLNDMVLLRGGYRPKRLRTRQLYLLQGFPGVGPVIAKRLLEYFGTPVRMMTATPEELALVDGIGREKARVIRGVLDECFSYPIAERS